MFGLSEKEIAIIRKTLAHYPSIEEAFIFGSRAKGNQRLGSDIDIAVLGTELESIIARVSGELNDEIPLPYTFDVVDLKSLDDSPLKEHILRIGVSFYTHRKIVS